MAGAATNGAVQELCEVQHGRGTAAGDPQNDHPASDREAGSLLFAGGR